MKNNKTSRIHLSSVLQALLVTFLWSTSWVLIKFGLKTNLPPLTFAGLRYSVAFLCLLPFVAGYKPIRKSLAGLSRNTWAELLMLGIVFYALTQGAQFLSLAFLPAATVTLMLNLSPIFVALFGCLIGNEKPSAIQVLGIIISALGVLIYFLPLENQNGNPLGLIAAFIGVLANSVSSILGRRLNKSGLSPLLITFISMGTGAFVLLFTGLATQGLGKLSIEHVFIIAWLAVINTAFAFWLWNNTLRALTAIESSILNNTMLPQIAILAWIFLGEVLDMKKLSGIILLMVGVFIVQLFGSGGHYKYFQRR